MWSGLAYIHDDAIVASTEEERQDSLLDNTETMHIERFEYMLSHLHSILITIQRSLSH